MKIIIRTFIDAGSGSEKLVAVLELPFSLTVEHTLPPDASDIPSDERCPFVGGAKKTRCVKTKHFSGEHIWEQTQ